MAQLRTRKERSLEVDGRFAQAKEILSARLVALLTRLSRLERTAKRLALLVLDSALCFAAVLIAFSLRVGAMDFPLGQPLLFSTIAIPISIAVFWAMGVYTSITRFAGARTIFQIAKAVAVSSGPLLIVFMIWSVPGIPRTMAILHPIIFFGLVAVSRIGARYVFMELVPARRSGAATNRVLIYGAGAAGQQLAAALRQEPGYQPIAFVDEDLRLHNQRLDGLQIQHSSRLERLLNALHIHTVMLALPDISRHKRKEIVNGLRQYHVHVQILPNFSEVVDGRVAISDVREVQIEDLLGREAVAPNELLLGRTVVGKNVLVTGAGGSIGSEICRQVLRVGANTLLLFDISESSLYQIDRELRHRASEYDRRPVKLVPLLGSVTDRQKMDEVFAAYNVDTVFHAAAYKHVPLVEANPVEGARNNILGTYRCGLAAQAHGVSDFILVSTDKAVRPTNVMGATKRAAEQVVQALDSQSSGMRCSMVRFGNVLGSSGSVVPLFRRQIEAGGPITLTHKDVNRYFMTIPEAANLVIQAGGLARGGEVFVLEMGKPVRIYDLAKMMVQLSGLTVRDERNPEGDIEIHEIGLRPGEKLYEELLIGDGAETTVHPRILKAREEHLTWPEIERCVKLIEKSRDPQVVLEQLSLVVSGFDRTTQGLVAN